MMGRMNAPHAPLPSLPWRTLLRLPVRAAQSFSEHKCTSAGAALAYYAAFSLAPVLVIAVSVCALVFGRDAIEGHLVQQINGLVGQQGAELIQEMIKASYLSDKKGLAAAMGIAATLMGATGYFAELSNAFERIFDAPQPYKKAWVALVMVRVRGLAIVLGVGVMLLISLVASAAIVIVNEYLTSWVSIAGWLPVASVLQQALTLTFLTILIGMLFRLLAPCVLPRRTLITGALVTAVLFEIGKWAIGLYLGSGSVGSTFGAAGSLAILLVWVYYVSLVLLYGAEMTLQMHRALKAHGAPAGTAAAAAA